MSKRKSSVRKRGFQQQRHMFLKGAGSLAATEVSRGILFNIRKEPRHDKRKNEN